MRKLDVFNHIWPPAFYAKLRAELPNMRDMAKRSEDVPMLVDLDERFRIMDLFEDYQQLLSLGSPPIEALAGPALAVELARIGNDGMAELVDRHPERFPGFTASLPMNDPAAALAEARRSIERLGALGVQIYSNVLGKPLDALEFRPLLRYLAQQHRPIWLHPARGADFPDYLSESRSLYEIWWTFGWPYETSVALARLVFSKVLDELPGLELIAHHAGGMVSFFEGRVGPGWDQLGKRTSHTDYTLLLKELRRRPIDYFRGFYVDTATFGSRAALRCALDFFGVEKMLFASDAPYDPERGPMYIRETIRAIDSLDLCDADKRKVYSENALRLTGLNARQPS